MRRCGVCVLFWSGVTVTRFCQLDVCISYAMQDDADDQKMQYIIDGLLDPGDVDVVKHWQHILQQKWKPLGTKMDQAHVPGLPPAFARKSDAPRDPGELARLVFGHENWKGIRTWRRKLLSYRSDGNRPPFYGSFSRRRCCYGVASHYVVFRYAVLCAIQFIVPALSRHFCPISVLCSLPSGSGVQQVHCAAVWYARVVFSSRIQIWIMR